MLHRDTVVALPKLVREDEDVHAWLQDNHDLWVEAIDKDVWQLDCRANYMGHQIDQIAVADGEVHVDYTVEYEIYYGCSDQDGSGWDQRDIRGKVVDGKLLFKTFQQPDPLSTCEEL